jgi:hypothetical protein
MLEAVGMTVGEGWRVGTGEIIAGVRVIGTRPLTGALHAIIPIKATPKAAFVSVFITSDLSIAAGREDRQPQEPLARRIRLLGSE